MSDDVASFFKTKKTKKGQRPHGVVVQTPDELAKRLERTVLQQQALDRENGIDQLEEEDLSFSSTKPPYNQQISTGSAGGGAATAGGGGEQNNEDSEWLDVHEQTEIDIAKLGIKELELREESEGDSNEEDESLASRKTWNLPGQEKGQKEQKSETKVTYAAGMDVDNGDEADGEHAHEPSEKTDIKKVEEDTDSSAKAATEKEADVEKKSARYVPPSKRFEQLSGASKPNAKRPDIEDSMEFPSLAAAGELQVEMEKSKKKKQQWKKVPLSSLATTPAPTPTAPSTVEPERHETKPTAWKMRAREPDPIPETKPPASQSQEPSGPPKSVYVPPHLRKQGGGP